MNVKDTFVNVTTHLKNAVDAIEIDKARYDQNIKELLAAPQVLARIMQQTVSEVEGMSQSQLILD